MVAQYVWLALFVIAVCFLLSWRLYRDKVPSWEHLFGMELSVISDKYGWVTEYRLFDEPVCFWERIYVQMDVNQLRKSNPHVSRRFFKDGKLLPLTRGLKIQIREYQGLLRHAYHHGTAGHPWRSPLLAAKPAPYDFCEIRFAKATSIVSSRFAAQ